MSVTRIRLLTLGVVMALVAAACGGSTTSDGPPPTTLAGSDTSDQPATTPSTTPGSTSAEPPTSAPTTAAEPRTITVYFSTGDGSDCTEVTAFTRTIDADEDPLEAAVLGLLAGPTAEEVRAGAGSFFSDETAAAVRSIEERPGGLVVIGFEDLRPLIPNASTSCGSAALLAQLNSTVLRYAERVRYEMLDSCALFGEWLQGECVEFTESGSIAATLSSAERAAASGCTPAAGLLDGRWFGYVDSTTDAEIQFDLACWFDGEAANDAASEDGMESPVPNDYYVRNDSDLVRTVSVASAAAVEWVPSLGSPETATVSFDEWRSERGSGAAPLGVWLTIEDGSVVSITEQWVP